jgi:orotidine-5'-phosphate decarboxylase
MHFADRLAAAVERCGNPVMLGIDPHLELLPEPFALARNPRAPRAERASVVADFCCELLELAAGRVPIIKPQSAFFEQLGADGVGSWARWSAAT